MPRFCANLTWLFTELPFEERFAAARQAGFDGVEVLFPYATAASEIRKLCARHDLKLVLINCPPPHDTGGPQGFAAVPGLEEQFRTDFVRAVHYAQASGAQHLHIMSGVANGPEARATLLGNLRWAADHAPDQSLTIEPINPDSMPGYFLNDFDLAREIVTTIDAPNLRLQFDAFHAAKITGDVAGTWEAMRDITTHIQVAQMPDRDEPDAGLIDYPAFFATRDAEGYMGWISGEYRPRTTTAQGLCWITR